VRLGLRMAKGFSRAHADEIVERRGDVPYRTVEDVWRRAHVPVAALERLAEADAFGALGLDRRQALWAIRGLSDARLPLFDQEEKEEETPPPLEGGGWGEGSIGSSHRPTPPPNLGPLRGPSPQGEGESLMPEPAVSLPPMTAGREVVEDYRSTGLSLRRHPVSFLRADLQAQRIVRCADLANAHDGQHLTVAGIVLVRQRPGSARGVLFITIEDETGHANLVVWSSVFDRQRRLVLTASMLACRGKVQREGEVIHVVADHLTDFSHLLRSVGQRGDDFPVRYTSADHFKHPASPDSRETKAIKVPTRDFR